LSILIPALPVEAWNTRFGTSIRTVKRDSKGRFINNKSAKQMIRVQDKANGVKFVKTSA
jgi:hypothetical protein